LDGIYGSFDDIELRTHSYIARQIPGGEIVGLVFGHTYFDPTPGYPLYGERKLTLKIQGYNLDPDVDRENVLSLLLGKLVKVADANDYRFEMMAWNPEDYEMDVYRGLGLKPFELPRIVKMVRSRIGWLKEHTMRQLKVEGFNEKIIDMIETGELFTTEQVANQSGLEYFDAAEQISKLLNRRIIVKKKKGLVLSQKYQTPTPRSQEDSEGGENGGDS
jgi:hypothetical protein